MLRVATFSCKREKGSARPLSRLRERVGVRGRRDAVIGDRQEAGQATDAVDFAAKRAAPFRARLLEDAEIEDGEGCRHDGIAAPRRRG
jgi:hypothetical protein